MTKQWLKSFFSNSIFLQSMIFSIISNNLPLWHWWQNQTDQLIKLNNLVSTKLMYQTKNLFSLHIHSISPSLYHVSLLIQIESSIFLFSLNWCILSLYPWSFIATCWLVSHFSLSKFSFWSYYWSVSHISPSLT